MSGGASDPFAAGNTGPAFMMPSDDSGGSRYEFSMDESEVTAALGVDANDWMADLGIDDEEEAAVVEGGGGASKV